MKKNLCWGLGFGGLALNLDQDVLVRLDHEIVAVRPLVARLALEVLFERLDGFILTKRA